MSSAGSYTIRSAQESDRQQITDLIRVEPHVHRHMDWRAPLDWLGCEPFLVVDAGGQAIAALACPPDHSQVAWIRLFVVSRNISAKNAWNHLWPATLEKLDLTSDLIITVMPLYDWLIGLVKNSGFIHKQDVILMINDLSGLPPRPSSYPGSIRSMRITDLQEVRRVDQAAFDRIWQNSQDMLEIALSQAEVATVVEIDGTIIGYQVSSSTTMGGHLARLAVLPSYWGRGIGYGLVYDMLQHYIQRGTQRVTVNTQGDNLASIKLYMRAGFLSTGESYPVYCYTP